MYKKDIKGWLKHLDFILIDVLSLQLSFIVICMITGGLHNPYAVSVERRLAVALFICQAAVIMFTRNYAGVIRRRAARELFAVTTHAAAVLLLTVFSEFVILRDPIPRLTVILPPVAFIVIAYPLRQINKARILHRASSRKGKKSLVLFTSADLVEEAMKKLYPERSYRDYEVTRIVLIAGDADGLNEKYGVSVSPLNDETMYEVRHDQVDEAFILQSADTVFPSELLDELVTIGIPVDYAAAPLFSGEREYAESRSLGDYKVITKSVRFVSS